MTGPRRLPAGWHDPGPATAAETIGEQLVDDDAPDRTPPPNRAARRAYARALKKKGHR